MEVVVGLCGWWDPTERRILLLRSFGS